MRKRVKQGDPSLAVAYLRVSTEDQKLGPEAQRADIERWCLRSGVIVCAWCQDQGVSGGAPIDRRAALLQALEQLKAHGAGLLIVARRDRLARDVIAAATIERLAAKQGARIVSAAGEGSDNDDPATVLLRRTVDAFAEYERAVIRTRIKAALSVKAQRGEAIGGKAPYGYRREGFQWVPDAMELAVIDLAHQFRAQGYSYARIAETLNRHGLRSRVNRPFHLTQIRRMLTRD